MLPDGHTRRAPCMRSCAHLSGALWLWTIVTAVCICLHFVPDARAQFGWHAPPAEHAWWSLLSTHFVHLGAAHLAANIAALSMICATAQVLQRGGLLAGLFAGALAAVSLGLVAGPWDIAWYVGLSGVLYGCFGGLVAELCAEPAPIRWLGWTLLLGAAVKLGLELGAGVGSMGVLGIPTAPPAHLYGFCGGLLTAAVARSRRRRS